MQDPPIWQRLLAALAYLLPWADAIGFGNGVLSLAQPLQLLARELAFADPVTGQPRCFVSRRQLALAGWPDTAPLTPHQALP